MKVMLTSSLGGSSKVNGIRVPSVLIQHNGLLDNLKSIWITNANVLIICADPSDYEKNDSVCACLKESLPKKGVVFYEDESCMEGSRFLTLRIKFWRNVNGKPNYHP